MTPKIILIHPPVAKPSEPPPGIAKLSAGLAACGVAHRLIDANLEGILFLLRSTAQAAAPSGRWDLRAFKNLEANLSALQNIDIFGNFSRYSRAVLDINRVLHLAGKPSGVNLSLADYTDSRLSPVKSGDLIRAAEVPETNPFHPYFSRQLTQALGESPDFIGFSLNYLSQAICTFAMIGFIKKIHPGQKIILGGSLTTSWAQNARLPRLFAGLVDEVVAGAGEEKLPALLGVKDIQRPASTDYGLLTKNTYLSPGVILPYSAARGCYWRQCAFCPEKAENNPYLPQSAAEAVNDLQMLTAQIKPSLIHLLDSSIAPALLKGLTAKAARHALVWLRARHRTFSR